MLQGVEDDEGAGASTGEVEDWVEAEIRGELAGLAHLTLEDLEEEEEDSGYHGNKEVW